MQVGYTYIGSSTASVKFICIELLRVIFIDQLHQLLPGNQLHLQTKLNRQVNVID